MTTVKNEQEQMFTRQEAADYLRIGVSTFSRLIKSGALPYVRINGRTLRIAKSSLDAYVRGEYANGVPGGTTVPAEQQDDISTYPPTPSILSELPADKSGENK